MNEKYTPIACGLYDRLEELATFGKECEIEYSENGNNPIKVVSRITDLRSLEGAEYLITENGLKIRLDWLIEVNGQKYKNSSCSI
ncbi:MAG: hypothetical protein HUU54_10965 [Ignavibacteriaceae bacterium]|nr:hypothetical protein [Ignavibacteriaceae bacterium]